MSGRGTGCQTIQWENQMAQIWYLVCSAAITIRSSCDQGFKKEREERRHNSDLLHLSDTEQGLKCEKMTNKNGATGLEPFIAHQPCERSYAGHEQSGYITISKHPRLMGEVPSHPAIICAAMCSGFSEHLTNIYLTV